MSANGSLKGQTQQTLGVGCSGCRGMKKKPGYITCSSCLQVTALLYKAQRFRYRQRDRIAMYERFQSL